MLKRQKTFSQKINNSIHHQVNALLQITDPNMHKEFEEFTDSYKSEMSTLSLVAFIFIATIPTIVWMITFVALAEINSSQKALAISSIAFLIVVALLFCSAYVPWTKSAPPLPDSKSQKSNPIDLESNISKPPHDTSQNAFVMFFKTHQRELQKLSYVLFIAFYSFRLLSRVLSGQCHSSSYASQFDCNPNAVVHGLPQDSFLALWIFPPAMSLLTREDSFFVKITGAIIILGSLVCSSFYVGIESTAISLVTYLFGCAIFLYDTEYHRLTVFFMYKHLQHTIQENEKRADEAHLNELRHMIGNVAHDLKTPLSAFVSGVDFIHLVIGELQRKLSEERLSDREFVNTSIVSMMECIRNMRNTNSFMLMTMNRCIDFTKASRGLKLSPKYDTIDIMDTLKLPICCIQDVQAQVEIELLDLPRSLCHFIITDKQWLQENLLCLLSNAVKYSHKGKVQVRISLETYSEEEKNDGDYDEEEEQRSMFRKQHSSSALEKITSSTRMSILELARSLFVTNGKSLSTRRNSKSKVYAVQGREDALYSPELAATLEEESITNRKFGFIQNQMKKESRSNSISVSSHSTAILRYQTGGGGGSRSVYNLQQQREQHLTNVYIRFEVIDEGIGISDDMMGKLFSPFRQAQRLTGGTGLGLYSLAKRVEALNGHFGVQHRTDMASGCIFWFDIPYRPDFTYEMHVQSLGCSSTSTTHNASFSHNPNHLNINNNNSNIPASPMSAAGFQSHSRSLSYAMNNFQRYSQDPNGVVAEGSNENSERDASGDEGWIGLKRSYSFLSGRGRSESQSQKHNTGYHSVNSSSTSYPSEVKYSGTSSSTRQDGKELSPPVGVLSKEGTFGELDVEDQDQFDDELTSVPSSSSRTLPPNSSKVVDHHSNSLDSFPYVASMKIPSIKTSFSKSNDKPQPDFPARSVQSRLSNAMYPTAASASMINSMMMISTPYDPTTIKKLNILVVDDSPTILKMTTLMFQRLGHQITTAVHGADALQKIFTRIEKYQSSLHEALSVATSRDDAEEVQSITSAGASTTTATNNNNHNNIPSPYGILFDVILMDLQMPIMDGIEATRRLRQYEQAMNPSKSKSPTSVSGGGSGSHSTPTNAPLLRMMQPMSSMPLTVPSADSILSTTMQDHPAAIPASATLGSKKTPTRFAATRSSMRSSFFNDIGHSIKRYVKGQPPIHHMIIGVSANSDYDTMEEAYAAGIDAFIPKPFSLDVFHDTYDRILTQQAIEASMHTAAANEENNQAHSPSSSSTLRSSITSAILNTVMSRSSSNGNIPFYNSITRGGGGGGAGGNNHVNVMRLNSCDENQ